MVGRNVLVASKLERGVVFAAVRAVAVLAATRFASLVDLFKTSLNDRDAGPFTALVSRSPRSRAASCIA